MFSKEKKLYDAPDIEKIPLSEEDMDKVSGGTEPDGSTTNGDNSSTDSNTGESDTGTGRGRGGGCDGLPYHRTAKTFSSGRGCDGVADPNRLRSFSSGRNSNC